MAGIGANIFAGMGMGTPPSPTVSNAAPMYGPSGSSSQTSPLSPRHGFGMALWWGAGGLLLLVLIRQSLPR